MGVAVDAQGSIYVADQGNHRVRKISNGIITTVAGNGTAGYSGDNVPAVNASLKFPQAVAVDTYGNLFIADTSNHRIRMVSNGIITTVAGDGEAGYGGDGGPASAAQLNSPEGVAVDSSGNLFISDTFNNRIRLVANGIITTLAGDGVAGFAGDGGAASAARVNNPEGLAVDTAGNVLFADTKNLRVRMLTPSGTPCGYSVSPNALFPPFAGGSISVVIQTSSGCAWGVSNLPDWITVQDNSSGSGSGSSTLKVAANTGAARVAYANVAGVGVKVTQQGAVPCTYSLNGAGAALPVAGGTVFVTITTSSGCSWTASSSLSWVTNLSSTSGMGTAAITFRVAANPNPARSSAITIADQSFTVQQAGGSITGLNVVGSMSQIASGGLWNTTITLMNNGSASATARLNFFANDGTALQLPLMFPQGSSAGPLLASTLEQTIAPGAAFVIQTAGQASQPSVSGWAQLLASGNISGFAVFAWNPGNGVQQAVSPLEKQNPSSFVLYFDNTNGASEGVALANVSAQAAIVPITIRDDTGATLVSTTRLLAAMGHTEFMVTDLFPPTANRRGTLEFQTPPGGQISMLGIAALSTGAITSVPATTK